LNRLAVHNPVEIAESRVRRQQALAICEEIGSTAGGHASVALRLGRRRAARVATAAATAVATATAIRNLRETKLHKFQHLATYVREDPVSTTPVGQSTSYFREILEQAAHVPANE